MRGLVMLLVGISTTSAHMSPFLSAMYNGPRDYPNGPNPVAPLGPGLTFDEWWFRGPEVRNSPPKDGSVAVLRAGGEFTLEIACAPEYTTYDGSDADGNVACDDPGPYHADPDALAVKQDLLSGCAIGIADVMDPNEATMDDFTIISVQKDCVATRNTTFSIPARMPKCTGDWCICGWVCSPQTGIANAYHTPFRCKIDGSPIDARPIAPPQDPVYCPDSRDDCTKGAKKLISTYNYPVNVPFTSNYDRPGYHDTFGFFDGPQDDIFLAEDPVPPSLVSSLAQASTLDSSLEPTSVSSKARPSSSRPSTPSPPAVSQVVWTLVPTTTPRWAALPTTTTSRSHTSSSAQTLDSLPTPSRRIPFRDRTTTTTILAPSPTTRSPRIPFASRLSLLPITTTIRAAAGPGPSPQPPQATRKTFRERQLDIDVSFEKKAKSHSAAASTEKKKRTRRRQKRSFGSRGDLVVGPSGSGGSSMSDRLVESMRRVVSHGAERVVVPLSKGSEMVEEKLVWTRVEL